MRWVVMVGLVVLASARLAAHDFWLAATPWDPGTQVTISANLGEIFPVATDHVVPEGVERWRVLGPGGEVHLDDALRKDGRALIADVQLPAPGAYLATMTIAPTSPGCTEPRSTATWWRRGSTGWWRRDAKPASPSPGH